MEIRGEAEREVREEGARAGGVRVLREPAGDEPPEEGDGDGGEEAEEEAEHGDGDTDGGGHGFHVELHGGGGVRVGGGGSVGLGPARPRTARFLLFRVVGR